MPCPDANRLAELAAGSLAGAPSDLEAHVAGCEECRTLLASLARSSLLEAVEPVELARGTCLGRFTILERVGAGGMGAVFAAYDPELDRRVALKVLHATGAQERLVSEARAMARLSHPNVVPVLDLGTENGRLYLAMEFVDGFTLAAWLAQRPRSVREVVATLLEAGRGLVAAHEAGLAHRDFKPENVLVGKDGRVRVTDFGLARVQSPLDPAGALEQTRGMGTPAYMSPEQFRGTEVGPASDQFSFCIVLWEALFGQRPFDEGSPPTLARLADAVIRGELRPTLQGRDVPARLRRVLQRGLQVEPAQRFPSMRALLEALEVESALSRRRLLLLGGAIVLAGALALGVFQSSRGQAQACSGAAPRLATTWNPERREAVRGAFAQTGLPYAARAFETFAAALDRYGADWVAMHTGACEATHAQEQSLEVLDLRMACLSRQLIELQAVVDLAARADARVVLKAEALAEGLRPVTACADVASLRAPGLPPADPRVRARLAELEGLVARAKAIEEAGRYDEGVSLGAAAVRLAREVGHAPALAEAHVRHGSLLHLAGRRRESESELEEGFAQAQLGRHDQLAARAAVGLVATLAEDSARSADGERWGRIARPVLARAGGDPLLEASLEDGLAALGINQGQYADALSHAQRALELTTRSGGPEHLQAIDAGIRVAKVLAELGRYDEAAATLRDLIATVDRVRGAGHPRTGDGYRALAGVLGRQGRFDEAQAAASRARDVWLRSLGAEHPLVAAADLTLGNIAYGRGHLEEAIQRYRAAQATWEKAGSAEAELAACHHNLGGVLGELGRHEEATAEEREALAIWVRVEGPEHPHVASCRQGLSFTLRRQGKPGEALPEARLALELRLKTLGGDHPYTALAQLEVAQVLLDLGQLAEAIRLLEAALPVLEKSAPAGNLMNARFTLGRALAGRGAPGDLSRARELGLRAREAATAARRSTAEVDRWLATLPR